MKNYDNSSFANGKISTSCAQCWRGSKMVVFVTGKCDKSCFYCPISEERRNKDRVWANERPVKSDKDILEEAKAMDATGASITGGEPLVAMRRTLHYIRLLKKQFDDFDIHLYSCGSRATRTRMKALSDAGLDEIRFHALDDFTPVLTALDLGMRVGIEVPCMPGDEKRLKRVVDFCAEHKIFLNLNEFEFSDSNYDEMLNHGFERIDENTYAVKGSRATGKKIIKYAEKRGVCAYFCPVRLKYATQMGNRMIRRARCSKQPWEKVTADGLLLKGVVYCSAAIAREEKVFYNKKKKRIETTVPKAKSIAKKRGLKGAVVEEFPCFDPWDFEATPF